MDLDQQVFLGITLGGILTATLTLLVLVLGDLLVRKHLRRRAKAVEGPGCDPAAAEEDRPWMSQALRAAVGPASLLLWTFGLHFALMTLVPVERLGPTGMRALTLVEWLRGAATLVALVWLLARLGRILEQALAAPAAREGADWNDRLLPLVVRALRLTLPFIAAMLAIPVLDISPALRTLAQNLLTVGLIGALAYLLLQVVNIATDVLLSRYRLDIADNLHARGVHTQVTVLRKVAVAGIALFALASMLMVFESVRRLGTTMLASAGIASVIIGFAAQRSIQTLLAGFQIAMTQPIRVDDVVIVEGEWGRIEEITLTYVVVLIWDQRRLVVPITYFIEKPFQNWTRTGSELLGTVMLYVDYSVPLEPLRAEFDRLVTSSPLWDGRVKVLQVTDSKESTMELRGLVSTNDASKGWDLRCHVRENLLVWLQNNYPGSLPKVRAELLSVDSAEPAASEGKPALAST